MSQSLLGQLRPLLHPMLVHFPIALLFASIALDWLGYWLKHPNLTRAGFYTLVLGAMGAGLAALSGPDHAAGDPSVPALLAAHQTFASLTVLLAVSLVAMRFVSVAGLRGIWALLYLAATLALLTFVSLTGYFGGEMTYHHAVGVTGAQASQALSSLAGSGVRPLLPAKPITALLGFLCIVGLGAWLALGHAMMPVYFDRWWRTVRRELANAGTPLWTVQRGIESAETTRLPVAQAAHSPGQVFAPRSALPPSRPVPGQSSTRGRSFR
jgi:uncharacterized membrane protein